MAKITPVGEAGLYHVHFLDARDPGFGQHPGGGVDPGYGVGGGFHPSHGLPGQGLHPGNRPPGSHPGFPDHELPDAPPPHLLPGYTLVMVRGPDGKWKYAAINPGTPPPRPLPEPLPPGGLPDQGVPPQGQHPSGQPLPPGVPPQYPTGQPLPGQPVPPPQHR
jgi:hypothetical protein